MTNTKAILGISFAAIFAVSMMYSQVLADDSTHFDIEKAEVKFDSETVFIEINAGSDIPQDGSAGAFGYGVLTAGASNVLAITTHLCASDSPVQGPAGDACAETVGLARLFGLDESQHNGAEFHAHILDLKVPEADSFCNGKAPFEVDIAGTVATENNVSPNYPLKVDDGEIKVTAQLGPSDVDPDGSDIAVVSFNIIPNFLTEDDPSTEVDENGLITNLCVDVKGAAAEVTE